MRKKGEKNKVYSAEFKINAIMDMREHHLSYRETATKHGLINKSEGGAINTLQRWERIYLEEGAEGLMKERRGRTCCASGTRKGRHITIKGDLHIEGTINCTDLTCENLHKQEHKLIIKY